MDIYLRSWLEPLSVFRLFRSPVPLSPPAEEEKAFSLFHTPSTSGSTNHSAELYKWNGAALSAARTNDTNRRKRDSCVSTRWKIVPDIDAIDSRITKSEMRHLSASRIHEGVTLPSVTNYQKKSIYIKKNIVISIIISYLSVDTFKIWLCACVILIRLRARDCSSPDVKCSTLQTQSLNARIS